MGYWLLNSEEKVVNKCHWFIFLNRCQDVFCDDVARHRDIIAHLFDRRKEKGRFIHHLRTWVNLLSFLGVSYRALGFQ